DGSYDAKFQVGADAIQTIGFSMKDVGATTNGANGMSANGGFTMSGIAQVATAVTGKAMSSLAAGISGVDSGLAQASVGFSSFGATT
ncbi:flagellin, partial [Pseudoalteromonas sp. B5MOD-1]